MGGRVEVSDLLLAGGDHCISRIICSRTSSSISTAARSMSMAFSFSYRYSTDFFEPLITFRLFRISRLCDSIFFGSCALRPFTLRPNR